MPWLLGSSSSKVNTHTFWLVVPPTWVKEIWESLVAPELGIQVDTNHHSGLAGVHAQLVPLHGAGAVVVGAAELEAEVVVHLHLRKDYFHWEGEALEDPRGKVYLDNESFAIPINWDRSAGGEKTPRDWTRSARQSWQSWQFVKIVVFLKENRLMIQEGLYLWKSFFCSDGVLPVIQLWWS